MKLKDIRINFPDFINFTRDNNIIEYQKYLELNLNIEDIHILSFTHENNPMIYYILKYCEMNKNLKLLKSLKTEYNKDIILRSFCAGKSLEHKINTEFNFIKTKHLI